MKKSEIKEYAKTILEEHGNLTICASKLEISRQTLYNRIEANPELQEAVREARQKIDDKVENVFYEKVLAGSTPELIFYVKTRMRNRGYVEKITVEHTVEGFLNAWNRLSEHEQQAVIAGLGGESQGEQLPN